MQNFIRDNLSAGPISYYGFSKIRNANISSTNFNRTFNLAARERKVDIEKKFHTL